VPADLNALLEATARHVSAFAAELGDAPTAARFAQLAEERCAALDDLMWCPARGCWRDLLLLPPGPGGGGAVGEGGADGVAGEAPWPPQGPAGWAAAAGTGGAAGAAGGPAGEGPPDSSWARAWGAGLPEAGPPELDPDLDFDMRPDGAPPADEAPGAGACPSSRAEAPPPPGRAAGAGAGPLAAVQLTGGAHPCPGLACRPFTPPLPPSRLLLIYRRAPHARMPRTRPTPLC
jgi:hypothetical protein